MNVIRNMWSEFVMYMDTTVPRGVNPKLWVQLKYSNRQKIDKLVEEHKIPRELLRKLAEYEFMAQDTETILQKCKIFMEGEQIDRKKEKNQ